MMKNSFILYSEVVIEDNPVDCIYFINGQCWAQPFATRTHTGPDIEFYKPTDEDQKNYCKEIRNFQTCPRFLAYQGHLRAMGLKKD